MEEALEGLMEVLMEVMAEVSQAEAMVAMVATIKVLGR